MTKRETVLDLNEADLMESWYWDIEKLEDELNAIRRKIRKAKKERELQPCLIRKSLFKKEYYIIHQFMLIKTENGLGILAESRRPATEEEIVLLEE